MRVGVSAWWKGQMSSYVTFHHGGFVWGGGKGFKKP